jgi:hypothetical protein
MGVINRPLVALLIGVSIAASALQASAQTGARPTSPKPTKITAHRIAVLGKCTQEAQLHPTSYDDTTGGFDAGIWVKCMTNGHETP